MTREHTDRLHPDIDEEALASGLAARRARSIAVFLDRTHRPVYIMAGRLTRDPEQRHDWTHDVLLKILEDVARGAFVYRRPGSFWAWFRTRAYFLLINQYRRQKQQNERWTAGEVGEAILARLPLDQEIDPTELMESVEARSIVEECLGRLPNSDQQRALRLLLFEDFSYQAVAEAIGAELNTVRSWIRRARAAVRRCVANSYGMTLDEQ